MLMAVTDLMCMQAATVEDAAVDDQQDDEADKAWLEQLKQQRQAAKAAAAGSTANGTLANKHDPSTASALDAGQGLTAVESGSQGDQQAPQQQQDGADKLEEARSSTRDLRRRRA